MWSVRRSPKLSVFSTLLQAHLASTSIQWPQYVERVPNCNSRVFGTVGLSLPSILNLPTLFSSFATLSHCDRNIEEGNSIEDNDDDGYSDNDEDVGEDFAKDGSSSLADEGFCNDVKTIVSILQESGNGTHELNQKLQLCGVSVSSELVVEVLSCLRNDWKASFAFFLWAGKQLGYAPSVREYHSMISILAKMRKFDTAWSLINEMRKVKSGQSLVTPQTLLIMIRRYSAMHDVGKAINTFYAHKRFQFDIGMEEFQNLLCALCRYKNVEDAEHLLFCNGNVFPFNTKSFNIILNGWCNVIGSLREAKRFWMEMSRRGIRYDVVSYASIISCYSKSNNLHDVLKFFKLMTGRGIEPDRKVYNAVIHALAKGGLVKEALNLLTSMEEKGIAPNTGTYNSMIKPMCRARRPDEAKKLFNDMLQRGLSPTNRTFHALFRILRTVEDVFDLLKKMKELGCEPNIETYIMLIRKFCRWRNFDSVFRLWNGMSHNGINPDRSAYIVLINGLVLNQKLEEAYKYHVEMKEKQLLPEPYLDELITTWETNKQMGCQSQIPDMKNQIESNHLSKKGGFPHKKFGQEDSAQQPGIRKIVREKGFSFVEQ